MIRTESKLYQFLRNFEGAGVPENDPTVLENGADFGGLAWFCKSGFGIRWVIEMIEPRPRNRTIDKSLKQIRNEIFTEPLATRPVPSCLINPLVIPP